MKADILRDKFLGYFKSKKHKIIESDSLIPKGDPTVLFTPAGMNQFKKEFLGFNSGFTRAATSQRCLRTDDLDKVGKTSGHHTFFEMLGNFSFGDYFKEEAIPLAWEFLTEELKIDKGRLWVSVYRDDDEAYKIWQNKIKIPEKRIIKLGDKENFWPSEAKQKGPNGPCGPCSEIFFDHGHDIGCKSPDCTPACNCGRFVEIWNLVFTQFNRKDGGALEPLPKKNIDTGMGLERLAAIMQGALNNFQTDLFQPLIKEIVSGAGCSLDSARDKQVPDNQKLVYAIADHIRAITFSIYDGILPSNESRGYIVRKLIRKSALHLRAMGINKPFLYKLVPVLGQIMKVPYPELTARRENIAEIILVEEKNFVNTLNGSDAILKNIYTAPFASWDPTTGGTKACLAYDTYGIPLEITLSWLNKQNAKFSEKDKEVFIASFADAFQDLKIRSKMQSTMKGDVFDLKELHLDVRETKFLGYQDLEAKAKIIKIIRSNAEVKKINPDEEAIIILDKTVFYPESGGQIADRGEIIKGKNVFEVLDTKKAGNAIMHIGRVKVGSFKKNDAVSLKINTERRLAIARNHTATHLLQAALRKVLGPHVKQQGSLVAEDRLRFDFTHFKNIEKGQLDRVEEVVNDYVLNNCPLEVKVMSLSLARKKGALAFFDEKYASKVRVVSISEFSQELCGGTHLDSTGQIGLFKITQEGSIASGIRRIEATTGTFAYKLIKKDQELLIEAASILNVEKENIAREVENKISRIKVLEKQISSQKAEEVKTSLDDIINQAEVINDIKIITMKQEGLEIAILRKTVDLIKGKTANAVIALGSITHGRALLVMGLTEDLLQKGLDASKLIVSIAAILGGSGGGRKDFAQAGGTKPDDFPKAFEELKKQVSKLI